jgi:hypothetical protein
MNKKFLILGVTLALTFSLAACGKAESPTTTPVTTQPSTNTKPEETTVPVTTAPAEEAFEEITLVESEDCIVKIVGFDENGLLGYGVKVYLENNTDDNLMFSVSDVSVNGFMIDPFWAATVSAEKKANETITFLTSDFETNGIEAVEEITFTLRVYDNENLNKEDIVKQTFTVNPN